MASTDRLCSSSQQRSLCVVWTPRRPDVCCFSTLRVASPLSSTRSPRSAAASQRSQTRDPTHTTHAATTPPSSLLPPFRHELASLRRLLWPLAAAAVALAVQRSADAVVASLFAGAVCGQSVVHTQGVHGQSEGEENSHGNASVKEEGTKHTSDSERRERKWSAAGRNICRSRRAVPCRAGLSPHSVPVSYTARHTRQQLATHNSAHSLTAGCPSSLFLCVARWPPARNLADPCPSPTAEPFIEHVNDFPDGVDAGELFTGRTGYTYDDIILLPGQSLTRTLVARA